jgi:hypothetical protein
MKTAIGMFSALLSCLFSKLLLLLLVNSGMNAVLVSFAVKTLVWTLNVGEGKAGGDVRASPAL